MKSVSFEKLILSELNSLNQMGSLGESFGCVYNTIQIKQHTLL